MILTCIEKEKHIMQLIDARLTDRDIDDAEITWNYESYGKSIFLCNKSMRHYIRMSNRYKKNIGNNEEPIQCSSFIRLDKRFESEKEVRFETAYVNVTDESLSLINNPHTLNMTFVPSEIENNSDIIVNLNIDTRNFSVLRYISNCDIRYTYRNIDDYQGCFMSIPEDKIGNIGKYLIMYALIYDKQELVYKKIKLFIKKNPNKVKAMEYLLELNYTTVLTDKELSLCKKVSENFENRSLGFKYDIKGSSIAPTQVILYKESDEKIIANHVEYNSDDYICLRIPDDKIEDVSYLSADIKSRLNGKKVKAISEFNMILPLQFFKVMKILYVFQIIDEGNHKKTKIKCLRSN